MAEKESASDVEPFAELCGPGVLVVDEVHVQHGEHDVGE